MSRLVSSHLVRFIILTCLAALFLANGTVAQDTSEPSAFKVEALNPGLPPLPDAIDRSTPQGAMESFFHYASKGDFDRAAHLLDLTDLPREDQAGRGAELAAQLHTIMDRKTVIPWDDLADRPDGRLRGSENEPGAGRDRRSIILDWLKLEGRSVPICINKVHPEGGDPAWVIAR